MRIFVLILIFSPPFISFFTNRCFSNYSIDKLLDHENRYGDTLIKDRRSLIKYAEPILFKTYGKKLILKERPYVIFFKDGIWTMDGTLPKKYTHGGAFHIVINAADGKVIKIIHYK
jgi:hypothetical protein